MLDIFKRLLASCGKNSNKAKFYAQPKPKTPDGYYFSSTGILRLVTNPDSKASKLSFTLY